MNEKRVVLYNKWSSQALEFNAIVDKQYCEAIKLRKQLLEIHKKMQSFSSGDGSYKVLQGTAYNILKMIHFMGHFQVQSRFNKIEDLGVLEQITIDPEAIQQEINELMLQKAEFTSFIVNEDCNQLYRACFGSSPALSKNTQTEQKQAVQEVKFTRQCPSNECRGFCNYKGVCELCKRAICVKCWLEIDQKDGEHMCKQEDIETRSLIISGSKPCPKCKVPIHRTEGCDHMFCTNCKTGFNWKTGNVISQSQNTNPLLQEWLRKTEADQFQDGCPTNLPAQVLRLIHRGSVMRANVLMTDIKIERVVSLESVRRLFSKLNNGFRILQQRFVDPTIIDVDQINHELRIRYLCKEIDERSFKREALQAAKKSKISIELHQLHEMLFVAILELLQTFFSSYEKHMDKWNQKQTDHQNNFFENVFDDVKESTSFYSFYQEWKDKIENLRLYYNSCLEALFNRVYLTTDRKDYRMNELSNNWSFQGHSDV